MNSLNLFLKSRYFRETAAANLSPFCKFETIVWFQNKAVFYIGGSIVVAGICFVVFKSSKKKGVPLTETKDDIKTTAN